MITNLGHYRILREIGRDSMGLVYLAHDELVKRNIAIKELILPETTPEAERAEAIERFKREAQTAGGLSHPSIVVIYGIVMDEGIPFIAMEYLEGMTLRELLGKGPLEPSRAVDITSQVCNALHFAHSRDIVHRDIKPENIFLLPDGRVKVTDFGIARAMTVATMTQTGMMVGTPGYMSPEQVKGERVDWRADIFSTGVLLYELLSGTNPFASENIASYVYKIVNEDIPPLPALAGSAHVHLQAVISRATAKAKEKRYQDASEMKGEMVTGQVVETVQLPSAAPATVRTGVPAAETEVLKPAPGTVMFPPQKSWKRFLKPAFVSLLLVALIAAVLVPVLVLTGGEEGGGVESGAEESKGEVETEGDASGIIGQAKWKFKSESGITTSPQVVNDVVYTVDEAGNLYAVDANSGLQKWFFQSQGLSVYDPVVYNDMVYFEDGRYLLKINALSGKEEWRIEIGSIRSSPSADNGVLFVGCWDGLAAIDAGSGEVKWKFKTEAVYSSPAVANDTVYFGDFRGYYYALSESTGEEKWRYKVEGAIASSSVVDGTAYFGTSYGMMVALEEESGKEKWAYAGGDQLWNPPAFGESLMYFATSGSNLIYAVDMDAGIEKWRFEVDRWIEGGPAYADGSVYIGCSDSRLYALNAKTGEEKWRFATGGGVSSTPAVYNEAIYFGSADGYLYALE